MNITQAEQNERVELLAKALESGEFKQGSGRLKDVDKSCCLGVACEIYKRETGKGKWEGEGPRLYNSGTYFCIEEVNRNYYYTLPKTIMDWFGFEGEDGNPILPTLPNTTIFTAVSYNDKYKKSFPEIAAAFRQQYIKNGS